MQIIHPYRHNTVTVCIFMPFDWRTAIGSLLNSSAIKKSLTRTSPERSNSCHILGLLEIQAIWGRCSLSSNEGASMSRSPQSCYESKKRVLAISADRESQICTWKPSDRVEKAKTLQNSPQSWRLPPDRSCVPSPCNTSKSILHQSGNIYKLLSYKLITRKSFPPHITAK